MYTAASLSNEGDAPLLLGRPELPIFAGDGIAGEGTRLAVNVACDDGRVLGFATLATDSGGVVDLEDLFVDPRFRRLGIGRRLVVDAAGTARASGHSHLLVTANPHAIAFYVSVGFVEIGQATTELGTGSRMQLDTGAA